jgi:hypothetical protein
MNEPKRNPTPEETAALEKIREKYRTPEQRSKHERVREIIKTEFPPKPSANPRAAKK